MQFIKLHKLIYLIYCKCIHFCTNVAKHQDQTHTFSRLQQTLSDVLLIHQMWQPPKIRRQHPLTYPTWGANTVSDYSGVNPLTWAQLPFPPAPLKSSISLPVYPRRNVVMNTEAISCTSIYQCSRCQYRGIADNKYVRVSFWQRS